MSRDPHIDLAAVLACDVSTLGTPQAIDVMSRVRSLRGLLDRFEADVTNRINELYEQGRSVPAADVLARNQHVSAAEARRRERRAKALERAKSFGDALANGSVAAEHADVLANVTAKLGDEIRHEFFGHEKTLLDRATTSSPEHFTRHCRDLISRLERDRGLTRDEQQRRDTRVTRKITPDGMHHLNGVFHPELGAKLFKALDEEVAKLVAARDDRTVDRTQLAAEALGNLVAAGHQDLRPGEAEILVLVDQATISHGQHDDTVCETDTGVSLPPETVRRLCCQGLIVPVFLVDGVPVNVGRGQRLANRAQRRALRAMYRTCGFGECDVPFGRCEIHHVVPWELGGPTDLQNLMPLCSRHHHVVHELGWSLHLAPDRELTIRQPDGTIYATQSMQVRSPRHEASVIHQMCERTRQRVAALQRC